MGPVMRESDWKIFRQLHQTALDRFCRRVLSEVAELSAAPGEKAHETYLRVFKLVKQRDKELAKAFDELSRSRAFLQLLIIRALGLVTEEELARFSSETREAMQRWDSASR